MFDFRPALGAFVAVVVGRRHVFGHALQSGNCIDRAAILSRNVRTNHARQRAVIAFDAHDAGGGHAQITRAEVAHADQIRSDERIFERHQHVEGGLRVFEHAFGIEERRERSGLAGDRLLQQVVRHFFLARPAEIALIVGRDAGKKRRGIDDVGVSGHRQRLGNLRGDQNVRVALLAPARVVVFAVIAAVSQSAQGVGAGRSQEHAESRGSRRAGQNRTLQKCPPAAGCFLLRVETHRYLFFITAHMISSCVIVATGEGNHGGR